MTMLLIEAFEKDGTPCTISMAHAIEHSVFTPYQRPEGSMGLSFQIIQKKVDELAHTICALCSTGPEGTTNADKKLTREASLALTALQEARMWANASIAVHGIGKNDPSTEGVTLK